MADTQKNTEKKYFYCIYKGIFIGVNGKILVYGKKCQFFFGCSSSSSTALIQPTRISPVAGKSSKGNKQTEEKNVLFTRNYSLAVSQTAKHYII